jgi:hypothetical protein
MIWKHISTVPSYTKNIQISHNTPNISEFFIKENSEIEECVIAIERALPFHVVNSM